MEHDHLCPWLLESGLPDKFGMMEAATCRCDLIARVREEEKEKWQSPLDLAIDDIKKIIGDI